MRKVSAQRNYFNLLTVLQSVVPDAVYEDLAILVELYELADDLNELANGITFAADLVSRKLRIMAVDPEGDFDAYEAGYKASDLAKIRGLIFRDKEAVREMRRDLDVNHLI